MPGRDPFRVPFVTGTGFAYAGGSLAILAAGIFRGELVATIGGVTLVSFAVFSGISVILVRFAWRRSLFSAEWLRPGLFRVTLSSSKKPPFLSPVFSEILYCLDYSTSDATGTGRFFPVRVPVSSVSADHEIPLPPRGIYTASNPRLRIGDYAGFFACTVPLAGNGGYEPLTVFPAPDAEPKTAIPPGKTGLTRGKSSFKRSEDLYETRNYQPGDDPRKINWKVYAHSGELSIRQGELLPPPANEYVFVLCSGTAADPTPEDKNRYDQLLSRSARLAAQLMSKNRSVTVVTADRRNRPWSVAVHPADPDASHTVQSAFSVPQLSPEAPPAERLLEAASEQATRLLFALPSQLSAARLPRSGAARTTVYLGPAPIPAMPGTFAGKLRSLVFIQPEGIHRENGGDFSRIFAEAERTLKKEGFSVKTI